MSEGLDLLDGTPVLDLKPYVPLFDAVDAEKIGWLTDRAETVHTLRADRRFEAPQMPETEQELLYFPNCECVAVPSGAFARVAPVLFVRDSFLN